MALTNVVDQLTPEEVAREPRDCGVVEAACWREGWTEGYRGRICHSWHGFIPHDHPENHAPEHPPVPKAAAYARMLEINQGVGGLGIQHPQMSEDMLAWLHATENDHADTVLALIADRARLTERLAEVERERDEARGERPSGFWSQREWEDWSNDLAMLLPEDAECWPGVNPEGAQESIIEAAIKYLLAEHATPSAETMPLADLLRDYRDGDEHGWDTEFAYLRRLHAEKVDRLTASVQENGIREPILLGTDGRVWDGHHRLCVADLLGLTEVPVEHATPNDPPQGEEPMIPTARCGSHDCGRAGTVKSERWSGYFCPSHALTGPAPAVADTGLSEGALAEAERDVLRAVVERVRALHRLTTVTGVEQACMEGECQHPQCHDGGESPEREFEVCAHCMDLAEQTGVTDEWFPGWVMWPCATAAQAGTGAQDEAGDGTCRGHKRWLSDREYEVVWHTPTPVAEHEQGEEGGR